MNEQEQPLVSPQAYVNAQFGQACQEIGIQPQEVVLLTIFQFLQTTPEDRGVKIAKLKKQFNEFAAAGDFEKLQKTIDDTVNEVQLQLSDALSLFWEKDLPDPDYSDGPSSPGAA